MYDNILCVYIYYTHTHIYIIPVRRGIVIATATIVLANLVPSPLSSDDCERLRTKAEHTFSILAR